MKKYLVKTKVHENKNAPLEMIAPHCDHAKSHVKIKRNFSMHKYWFSYGLSFCQEKFAKVSHQRDATK